jgi:hypothetical protein
VNVPSDSGAILLYDESGSIVNLEAVKIQFKNNLKTKKMDNNQDAQKVLELSAQNTTLTAQLAARDTKIAALEAKVKAFEQGRITTLVDAAIAEKKIGADEKQTYTDLANVSFESVEKILSKMQGVQRVAAQMSASTPVTASWDELDKGGKLAALKAEQPEEFKRLYKEKFGVEPKLI